MRIDGPWFKDERGRALMLRGVNLSGSSKYPTRPDGASHNLDDLFNHRDVSFVGRPCPLEEADEHFARLRHWGFNVLRFLVTWEAVEHAGPGIYDEEYLDYLEAMVRKAGEHGLKLFIDPHQDVWSRFSGGDGAPGWTLEAAGFDMPRLHETGAAFVHAIHGDPYPRMIWPTNGTKLAAATMFTLFFGGNDFAPATKIDGEPAQEYLQRHYIDSIVQIAKRLKGLDAVVGYDSLNEPLPGWIGWQDLRRAGGLMRLGDTPTPLQAMALGCGIPQKVARYAITPFGMLPVARRLVNPQGVSAWAPDRQCVWRENAVWDTDAQGRPQLLRPAHFSHVNGRKVDFANDYFLPFAKRYLEAIRKVDQDAILFLETEAARPPPRWPNPPGVAFAPHWYDAMLLVTKRHVPWLGVDFRTERPVFGRRRVQRSFAGQLRHLKESAFRELGDVPVLLGEFGIPFDLSGGRAFRTGDYREQASALNRTLEAVEANLLNSTLWNYTPNNTHARGDGWNGEDLSIFSKDDMAAPDASGGRALDAAVRPYAMAVAGEPLTLEYSYRRREFTLVYRPDPSLKAATEIFVPSMHFGADYLAEATSGRLERDPERQRLVHHLSEHAGPVTISIRLSR